MSLPQTRFAAEKSRHSFLQYTQDVVADAMTEEVVPPIDERGKQYPDGEVKSMHTTVQTVHTENPIREDSARLGSLLHDLDR